METVQIEAKIYLQYLMKIFLSAGMADYKLDIYLVLMTRWEGGGEEGGQLG